MWNHPLHESSGVSDIFYVNSYLIEVLVLSYSEQSGMDSFE